MRMWPQLMLKDFPICCWFTNPGSEEKGYRQLKSIGSWRGLRLYPVCLSTSPVSLVEYIPWLFALQLPGHHHFTSAILWRKCSEATSQDGSMSGTVPESRTHFQAKLLQSPSRETWGNLRPVMPSHSTRCPFTPTSFPFIRILFSLSPPVR